MIRITPNTVNRVLFCLENFVEIRKQLRSFVEFKMLSAVTQVEVKDCKRFLKDCKTISLCEPVLEARNNLSGLLLKA